jgi:hypothetical protein
MYIAGRRWKDRRKRKGELFVRQGWQWGRGRRLLDDHRPVEHALARDVYYGRRGRINARELHEQMNSCSCLTLILACVIYWQAKEISRVVRCREPEDGDIDVVMLEHVSPIEWDNVILYGQYVLDRDQVC